MAARDRTLWRAGWRFPRALVVAVALAAGCGAPPPAVDPASRPYHVNDQAFEIHWALEQEGGRARAVGEVVARTDREVQLTLGLFGLDQRGQVVSRGTTYAHSRFARGPIPFAIDLAPTGREVRYEVRVLQFFFTGYRGG